MIKLGSVEQMSAGRKNKILPLPHGGKSLSPVCDFSRMALHGTEKNDKLPPVCVGLDVKPSRFQAADCILHITFQPNQGLNAPQRMPG